MATTSKKCQHGFFVKRQHINLKLVFNHLGSGVKNRGHPGAFFGFTFVFRGEKKRQYINTDK
jgi:hypothetical protein